MSTYNGEKFIRTQIDSILAQNCQADIDIIVRDDGSKDSTLKILEEYGIKYYTGDNFGPAKSFFELIKRTEGYDYYAFADQDDFWNDNKIEKSMKALESYKGPALMYSNPELVDSGLNTLNRKVYRKIPRTNMETVICAGNIIGCTIMFNEALARVVREKELPTKIRMHDYYLAAVCVAVGGSIIYDNNSYMKYRQHGGNTEGVPVSSSDTIGNRLGEIKTKSIISIADQSREILDAYYSEIPNINKKWLEKVSNYRKSVINRILLALSFKTHYITMNKSISVRISILLGNR